MEHVNLRGSIFNLKLNELKKSPNQNGFVVDSFVRGNVNIEINFNTEIKLHSIILNSKVNSQVSNGFIISSSISNSNSFKQIARILNDTNKTCYDYEFTRRGTSNSNDQLINKAYFSVNNQAFLNRLTSINIQITRTLNSTNCCLKELKIYGYLSNSIQSDQKTINNDEEKEISNKNLTNIPNEFIDSITQEMIRVPIRLPSSKIVDKSTLDRYMEEQIKNKETIKDPFTNIPLEKNSLKIDDSLKSKIDHFLLDNNSLSEKDSSKKRKSNEQYCSLCLNSKSTGKNFYEITSCTHCFCKTCLISLNKICVICKQKFDNTQILRIY
jgi:hypothetical protein